MNSTGNSKVVKDSEKSESLYALNSVCEMHLRNPVLQNDQALSTELLDAKKRMEVWIRERGEGVSGDNHGISMFKKWFQPLPELPMAGMENFIDRYGDQCYVQCFSLVHPRDFTLQRNNLLPLYMASAALCLFQMPDAGEMLKMAEEQSRFRVGYYWFQGLMHLIFSELKEARASFSQVITDDLHFSRGFHPTLYAWACERKHDCRILMYQF